MIDLHCHILPGLDDGAPDISVSLQMARMAIVDGITTVACTPHVFPGVYNNSQEGIGHAFDHLAEALRQEQVPLHLVMGADVHIAPDLLQGLRSGRIPTLAESRYFLLEPPNHVAPPRLFDLAFNLMTAGYVPILTHPERLSWIDGHYALIKRMHAAGVLMQITGGSILGRFGSAPRYWAERMLDDALVDLMATDAHHSRRRRPLLSEAREAVARCTDRQTAERIVAIVPQRILADVLPSAVRQP